MWPFWTLTHLNVALHHALPRQSDYESFKSEKCFSKKPSGGDHSSHVADDKGSRASTLAPTGLCQDKCQPLHSPRLSRYQTRFPRKLQSSVAEVMGKVWFPDQRKPSLPGDLHSSKENTPLRVRFF